MTRPAVFLDRDGVLNHPIVRDGKPYAPGCLEEFELYPDAAEACGILKKAGFLLVVATNQPDVGRGKQSQAAVEAIHAHLMKLIPLDRIEVCYDGGETPSTFRKPAPGMLLRAANELGIDLPQSYMIGDRWRDIDCGHAAGCKTIFIDRGYTESLRQQPDFRATSLLEAANNIITDSRSNKSKESRAKTQRRKG